MPFEDFYKSADQYAHRWRLCLIAAIFIIAAYFTVPFFVMSLFESPPLPSAQLKPPPPENLRGKADALCLSLPEPERFLMTNAGEEKIVDDAAKVVYTYHSERGFEEIIPQFLIWFDEHEWERTETEIYDGEGDPDPMYYFLKGSRHVSIRYFDLKKNNRDAGARYEIVCTVKKLYLTD